MIHLRITASVNALHGHAASVNLRKTRRKSTICAVAAVLLLSLTSIPAMAQEISILGPGRGWKLLPQRGPEGQNVYGYDCHVVVRRIVHRYASNKAWHTRMVAR